MHIKSLTIAGFKSYRDSVKIEFSPATTVIVGRNGFGKSNIFDGASGGGGGGTPAGASSPPFSPTPPPHPAAIRFVFGDQFGSLRAEDKSQLIFDQGKEHFLQAEVTIELDNSDGRVPLEGATVEVGRTVGL